MNKWYIFESPILSVKKKKKKLVPNFFLPTVPVKVLPQERDNQNI